MDDQSGVARLVELARAGDIETLLATIWSDPADDCEAVAYTWLHVVADFGHPEAQDRIDDLLEGSGLRFDDDGLILGAVHHELALAYLTGGDGLPVDFDKARRHLHQMIDLGYLAQISDAAELMAESRSALGPAAREVFDEVVARSV